MTLAYWKAFTWKGFWLKCNPEYSMWKDDAVTEGRKLCK